MKKLLSFILILSFCLSLISCTPNSRNLTEEIPKDNNDVSVGVDKDIAPTIKEGAQTPEEAVMGFSAELFKKSYAEDKNTLISPLSVAIALSMTAGGSNGDTYSEFQDLLGMGVTLPEMNKFYKALCESFDDVTYADVNVANSIWIRDNKDMISVKNTFLDFADEYFDADIFLSPFNKATLRDINSWVKEETDGMIKKIIDEIDPQTVMYLINALSFDAEWKSKYDDTNDYFKFKNKNGEYEQVTGMISNERLYLEDENTTGFIKPYKGDEFSFAVFLPDENTDIDSYVNSLSAKKLMSLINNASEETVETVLPKFTYEYDISLKEPLTEMGLISAFNSSKADLSGMGESSMGNLYVSKVLHKTFIEVAEEGTKAAAVTAVAVDCESAMEIVEIKKVIVNRPFVFAIIDNVANVPLFIGSVLSVE